MMSVQYGIIHVKRGVVSVEKKAKEVIDAVYGILPPKWKLHEDNGNVDTVEELCSRWLCENIDLTTFDVDFQYRRLVSH